jgi:hypothetical protein
MWSSVRIYGLTNENYGVNRYLVGCVLIEYMRAGPRRMPQSLA